MRLLLTTASSGKMAGFAKKKFYELERLRKRMGVAILTKRIIVAGYFIHIQTADWGDYIRIGGMPMVPTMVLSGALGTFLYDYLENSLSGGTKTINGQLFQGQYDHLFQLQSDAFLAVNKDKIAAVRALPDSFAAAGLFPKDNLSVLLVNNMISVYRAEEVRFIDKVSMPARGGWGVQKAGHTDITKRLSSHLLYSGVLSIPPNIGASQWNNIISPELDLAAPDVSTYQSFGGAWRWYPRIWNPAIGNGLFLFQGMYYGSVQGGGFWGPCTEVEARYGCVLDCRGGSKPFGYAEFLSSTTYSGHEFEPDGEQKHIRAFFFRDFWEPSSEIFYDESQGEIWFQNDYWEGCPAADFSIDFSQHFDVEAESNDVYLDWWSTADIVSDDILVDPRPLEGVIAVGATSKKWALYRHSGSSGLIREGVGYRDHSISHDGAVVSVLYQETGDDGEVDHVFVFDLAGKEDEEAPGAGSGKVLADNVVPKKSGELLFGQLIPIDISKPPTPVTVIDELMTTAEIPAYRDKGFDVSMFGMSHPWPAANGHQASGWKVELLDGLIARGFKWLDECWENAKYTVYHDEDINPFESTNLIMAGGPNGRHGTVGDISAVGFPSAGGSSPAGGGSVVERSGITFGEEVPFGCLGATNNAKGPLEWTGDVEDTELFGETGWCWKPIAGCSTDSSGNPTGKVTLTDACGQTSEREFSFDPLEITGTDEPEVGDHYSASNGVAPYTYSFTGGSIDSETGVIESVTSCGGPGGNGAMASVSATDSCGRTASIEVRLPGGSWIRTGEDLWDNFIPIANEGCTAINGGVKIDYSWETYGGCTYYYTLDCELVASHPHLLLTNPCTGDAMRYECVEYPYWCYSYKVKSKAIVSNWECPE